MATVHESVISVGIIGAGAIVSDAHLPVLAAMENLSVDWITDADPERARSLARHYGTRAVELPDSPRDLPSADLVLIAIPYGAREPYYEALQEREVGLYVEKPIARTVAEHRRLCDRFPSHRIAHGFQRRSFGPTRLARRLVEDQPFGPLRSIRYEMGTPGAIPFLGFRSNLAMAGGGILLEHGVHGLDASLFIAGAQRVRIQQVQMVREQGLDVHVEAEMRIATDRGDEVDFSLILSWLRETDAGIRLRFDRAEVHFSIYDPKGNIVMLFGDSGKAVRLAPAALEPFPVSVNQVFHHHWKTFVDGMRTASPNYTSADQSILTTEIVESCYAVDDGPPAGVP